MLTMEQALRNILKVQGQHEGTLVDQEARSIGGNIRIYNVPKDKAGSAMMTFVETLLRDKLDFSLTTELHIKRAHRALAPKPTAAGKPRWIVVKFHQYKTKEEVLCKAWGKRVSETTRHSFFDYDNLVRVLSKRK